MKGTRSILSFMVRVPQTFDAKGIQDVFRSNGFSVGQVQVWGDRPTRIILIDLKTWLGSSEAYRRFDAIIERLGAYYAPNHKKWIIRY